MRKPKMLINEPEQTFIKVDTQKEIRCQNPLCNRLLMKGHIKAIEIKCSQCKTLQHFEEL